MDTTCYLNQLFYPKRFKSIIAKAIKRLKQVQNVTPFDAIAFRGMSGAMVAPIVAHELGVKPILVRKHSDSSHVWYNINHLNGFNNYIILDDFIETGQTVRIIIQDIKEWMPQTHCVGIYCYTNVFNKHKLQKKQLLIPNIKILNLRLKNKLTKNKVVV